MPNPITFTWIERFPARLGFRLSGGVIFPLALNMDNFGGCHVTPLFGF
jgi:hypothetical protein